jgi:hypothetical protein
VPQVLADLGRLRAHVSRHVGWAALTVGAAALVLLAVALAVPKANGCLVPVELSGSADTVNALLRGCPQQSVADVRSALYWELLLVVVYAVTLPLICGVGAYALAFGRGRVVLRLAAWFAVFAAVLDVLTVVVLEVTLRGTPPALGGLVAAQGLTIAAIVALLLPLACAVVVVAVVLWRWVGSLVPHSKPLASTVGGTVPVHPDPGLAGRRAWAGNYAVPVGHVPDGPRTGICLSGGGIRSATFAMGALQALAERGVVARARFLATVSGGGYFGSAYQTLRWMSVRPETDGHVGVPLAVDDAFGRGTAEEDYLRRHGKYIADGAGQWVVALSVVLRNTLIGIGLIYAAILVLAWLAAEVYDNLIGDVWSARLFPTGHNASPSYASGTWVAFGVLVGLALAVWVASPVVPLKARGPMQRTAGVLGGLAAGVVLVAVLVPALTAWVTSVTNPSSSGSGQTGSGGGGPGAGVLVALIAAVTTVWNALARVRAQPGAPGAQPSTFGKILAGAGFAVRFLLTVAVVAALVFLGAVAFAAELHTAMYELRTGNTRPAKVWLALGVLVVLFLAFDQTRMSLHMFYKRRLATAFSVQRTATGAQERPWGTLTRLSTYGEPLDAMGNVAAEQGTDGLRLVICAAAHVSGPEVAPPGRRVVPFVFSSDFVGSPRLGYLSTAALETATEGTSYQSDVTLLAGAAISGAAFASAMGRASGPFDTLLAISNARLGAWLPNPRYHWLRTDPDGLATLPGLEPYRKALPRIRRLGYYVREIAGLYPVDDRFVYVTDGGHYENLGLVELLRRQCDAIFCIDSSGDHSLAHALAEAAALAYEELGVTISVDGMDLATLSGADATEPNVDLQGLHRRLAGRSVVTGTFTYPDGFGPPGAHPLVVGKALLGTDLLDRPEMFPLLAYATVQSEFPSDTTADQWFDVDRYQGYLVLGRLVGSRMADVRRESPAPKG